LFEEVFLTAVTSAALFGGALLWVSYAERRRASLKARLTAIVTGSSRTDPPVVSLRKPPPQRKALPATIAARLDVALASTGNRIGALHLFVAGIVAAATIGSVALVGKFPPAFVIGFCATAAIGAPALLLQIAQSRYQRRFLDVFPDALDLIVGKEMEEALQHAADRIRVPDFQFFVVSLLLQRQTGGGIAETLTNLSTIIRQRRALRRKARALTAEAQASAAVVATAPFIAGGGLFLIDRNLMSVLFVDPRGRFMLGLAVVCLLFGVATMKALISKNLR